MAHQRKVDLPAQLSAGATAEIEEILEECRLQGDADPPSVLSKWTIRALAQGRRQVVMTFEAVTPAKP